MGKTATESKALGSPLGRMPREPETGTETGNKVPGLSESFALGSGALGLSETKGLGNKDLGLSGDKISGKGEKLCI
jgi:hypothetical protein